MKRILTTCLLLLSSSIALADITVNSNGITWTDDGWYEVQNTEDFLFLCQGGTGCETGPGVFNVINHTTGERWEGVSVGLQVQGNVISWPGDGWYQVQLNGDEGSSLCAGASSCEVTPGIYNVINHTSGMRWDGISVPGTSVPGFTATAPEQPLDDGTPGATPADDSEASAGSPSTDDPSATVGAATLAELVMAAANITEPESSLSILERALATTGLIEPLQQAGDVYTLFAPTDSAFSALGDSELEALLADTDRLRDILMRHLLLGPAFDAADLRLLAGFDIGAGNGEMLVPNYDGATLSINQVNVSNPDIFGNNGVIHLVDAILPAQSGYGTDSGSGSGTGTGSDSGSDTPLDDGAAPADSITDILRGASGFSGDTGFSTLVLALQATGLDQTLDASDANSTIFAPTDAAFQAIGDDAVAALFADTDELRKVLLYHVVQSPEASTGLTDGRRLESASGSYLTISLRSGGVRGVNDATITRADITASNGFIHIINKVLMPPVNSSSGFNESDSGSTSTDTTSGSTDTSGDSTKTISETLADAGQFTTLLSLLESANVLEVLDSNDGTYTLFAPTDSAFAALPDDQLNELRNNPDLLRDRLLYHVLAGRRFLADDLIDVDGRGIIAGNGAVVAITAVGSGGLRINMANVTNPDSLVNNGVIHTIDQVLAVPEITP